MLNHPIYLSTLTLHHWFKHFLIFTSLPFCNLTIGLENLLAFLNRILSSSTIIDLDFLSCENARVEYSTFNDYYNIKKMGTGASASLLGLLKRFTVKMLIVTASDDTITPLTHNRV